MKTVNCFLRMRRFRDAGGRLNQQPVAISAISRERNPNHLPPLLSCTSFLHGQTFSLTDSCHWLLGTLGTILLLILFGTTCPAVAQDSNVLIDFSGYPADVFPTYCRDGYVADTSNPPIQTQAGEPLFTPYATFSGGEVELRRFDANPPINERYRSNPLAMAIYRPSPSPSVIPSLN